MSDALNFSTPPGSRFFHVMAKPVGPLCNLACDYCFYLEKEQLFPAGEEFRMSDAVLEEYIRQNCRAQKTPEVTFAWQGGEPTLAGLDFYRKAVALQRRYAGGRKIQNTFQTNGVLLDDDWCRFFAREGFLVGLSLDGPEHIHNRYRNGSFEQVMAALEKLKEHQIEFNVLACITRESADEGAEVYRFLKEQGVTYMQFIPIVERSDKILPWSVLPEGFGDFLCAVFDEWIKEDVGRVFVNYFDEALSAWCGRVPSMCTLARTCGNAVALEHDGGVYSCDHFVYPEFSLGNITELSLEEMLYSEKQLKFGQDKKDTLPEVCRSCEFLFTCNGGCPKHRFDRTDGGEAGLNYLCAGYKNFFAHINPVMKRMAELVTSGRPAAEIMEEA